MSAKGKKEAVVTEERAKRWRVPKGYIYVLEDVCKGCGFCIEFCPRKVLARAEHYNAKGYHPPEATDPEACVLCGFCELVCPDFAIWTEKETTEGTEKMDHKDTKAQRTQR
ncbi:MAG: 4Fe-4S binding protein [Clostridia bacterium]|nr:4Fe-4S binding protein [Clostridia bacterium]